MSITKEVPVYEEIIICTNCGYKRSIRNSWRFDRECEVCKKEGCANCMKPFEKNDTHCYHLECSKNMPKEDRNRPYFGKNQIVRREDIKFGKKYRLHYNNGDSRIIILRGFHYVPFNGDIFEYLTEDHIECAGYLSHMGVESPFSDGSWKENLWLEKLESTDADGIQGGL
jgi:hypothetical protein